MKAIFLSDKNVRLHSLSVLLVATIAMIGCAKRAKPVSERIFSLTIVLMGPLEPGPQATLPEDIIKLSLPMQEKNCPSTAFIPQLQLVRLDSSELKETRLDTMPKDDWKRKIAKFLGARRDISRLRQAIETKVRGLRLPEELFSSKSTTKPVDENKLKGYLSKIGAKYVFVLAKDKTHSWGKLNDIKVTAATDADKLSQHIASYLCNEAPADKVPATKYFVVYGTMAILPPPLELSRTDSEGEGVPPGGVESSLEARQHLDQGMIYVSLAKQDPGTASENYENALKEFRRAIELHPNWGVAHANLGLVYMQQKKFDLALIQLTKAAELEPRDPMIRYNLAALYSLQNKLDLALNELDKALEYGFKNYDSLRPTGSESDPDLNNLRRHPEFRKVLEKHKVFISG